MAALCATPGLAQGVEPIAIDNTAPHAVKLGILLAAFLFILFTMRRVRLSHALRTFAIWLAIGVVLVALYAYRGPLESAAREVASVLIPGITISRGETVVVHRAFGGHFLLNGEVDGAAVQFLFDTGASTVVLAADDAARAGFNPAALDYRLPVMTASGMTRVAPVRLAEVAVGDITLRGVRAAVAKEGDLDQSLLGMTFLNRLTGYEVRRDRLILNP
jgi:aspartyl protease family protein